MICVYIMHAEIFEVYNLLPNTSCICDAWGCVLQSVKTIANHVSSSSSLSDSSSGSCPPDKNG